MTVTGQRTPLLDAEELGRAGANRPSFVGATMLGRFLVCQVVPGGMGLVYACVDTESEVLVAVKTFRPERRAAHALRRQFLEEVETWLHLEPHRNIVSLLSFERGPDAIPFLVMEYVLPLPGMLDPSLRSLLRKGPLDQRATAKLGAEVAAAMLHFGRGAKRAVHLDLKPENILIDYEGIAQVTDFGLARVEPGDERDERQGPSSASAGLSTEQYRAPELWDVAPVIGPGCDIYALGCILYEALTGKMCCGGAGDDCRALHVGGVAEQAAMKLHGALGEVVRRCVTRDLRERYASWDDVFAALKRVFEAEGAVWQPPAPADAADEARRRALGWLALGAAHFDRGDLARAEYWVEKALVASRDSVDEALEASSRIGLAGVLRQRGDFASALEHSKAALALARKLDDVRGQSCAHHSCGCCLVALGQSQLAVEHFEMDLQLTRESGDEGLQITLCDMARAFRVQGEFHRAIDTLNEAVRVAKAESDELTHFRAENALGNCLYEQARYVESQARYETACTIAKRAGYAFGTCLALTNLGNAFAQCGRMMQAFDAFSEAIDTATKAGIPELSLRPRARLSRLLARLDYGRAVELAYEGIGIAEAHGTWSDHADALNDLAAISLDAQEPQQAVPALDALLRLLAEHADVEREARALSLLGNAYTLLGMVEKAIEVQRRVLAIHEHAVDELGVATTQVNLAVAMWRAGQLSEACVLARQAAHAFHEMKRHDYFERACALVRGIEENRRASTRPS